MLLFKFIIIRKYLLLIISILLTIQKELIILNLHLFIYLFLIHITDINRLMILI